ncbi:hypothetical protein [Amycolatopsis sp. PS_44_ISF1]|nr:hypothetical protein [Amycolatopsis sp. PS_44_ISF1]MDT8912061.1 hypothetical protein [Amycolatopsis sp. PS_44_ISF1]
MDDISETGSFLDVGDILARIAAEQDEILAAEELAAAQLDCAERA